MSNELTLAFKASFPQLASDITYNDVAKMFLTPGYISQAGNMYQEGVRFSRRMAIKFDIGHGYAHTFLNGIQLFMWDESRPKMVAHRTYSNFWWSENDTNYEVTRVVKDYLVNESKVQGLHGIPDCEFERLAKELVSDTLATTAMIGSQNLSDNTPPCTSGDNS